MGNGSLTISEGRQVPLLLSLVLASRKMGLECAQGSSVRIQGVAHANAPPGMLPPRPHVSFLACSGLCSSVTVSPPCHRVTPHPIPSSSVLTLLRVFFVVPPDLLQMDLLLYCQPPLIPL